MIYSEYEILNRAMEFAYDACSSGENKGCRPRYVRKQCDIIVQIYEDKIEECCFDYDMIRRIDFILKGFFFATGLKSKTSYHESLDGWQLCFILSLLCVKHREDTSERWFDTGMLLISRKQGKTNVNAGINAILMLIESRFAEYYSVSATKDLSDRAMKDLAMLIKSSPDAQDYFKVLESKVECLETESIFKSVACNENTGGNAVQGTSIIIDEFLALKSRAIVDGYASSQYSVKNALITYISTRYPGDDALYEQVDLHKKILDKGEISNTLSLIFEPDHPELWDSSKEEDYIPVLRQTNPLSWTLYQQGITKNWDKLLKDRETAIQMPSAAVSYLTKNLNIEQNKSSGEQYIPMNIFRERSTKESIDFRGRSVCGGLDLSISYDISALSLSYIEDDIIYTKSHGYICQGKLDRGDKDGFDYLAAEELGEVTIHPTKIVDYKLIAQDIKDFVEFWGCQLTLHVDPNNASLLMSEVAECANITVLPIEQSPRRLSPLIKFFRNKCFDEKVIYEENSLLEYCAANATTTFSGLDQERLVRISKGKHKKIDLIVSTIFSMSDLQEEGEAWISQI